MSTTSPDAALERVAIAPAAWKDRYLAKRRPQRPAAPPQKLPQDEQPIPTPLHPVQLPRKSMERHLIDTIESVVYSMDNITTVQAFFPQLLEYKPLRPLNYAVRQVNKLYILYLLLQLRKCVARCMTINRYFRLLARESSLLSQYNVELQNSMKQQLAIWRQDLGRILWQTKLDMTAYAVDLILNVGLVLRKTGRGMQVLGFLSYVLGLFSSQGHDEEEHQREGVLLTLKERYQ